jgi:hypothetical protein
MTRLEKRSVVFWILVALLAVFAVYVLFGCAPPAQLHGRAAFDRWVAEHTTTVHEAIAVTLADGGIRHAAGYYDGSTIHLDDAELASWEASYPGAAKWITVHEAVHAVGFSGLFFIHPDPSTATHPEPCDIATGCPSAERFAQCGAAVVLGVAAPWTDDTTGYWSCPPEWLAWTRQALISVGAW